MTLDQWPTTGGRTSSSGTSGAPEGGVDAHGPDERYRDLLRGAGEGPPVVIVHGALSDHTAARQQLEAFSDTYTAIAYDVRGHGNTTNPSDTPYSIDALAEDLHGFVTALGLERPVVCGVSMGGMIAQVYASRYPDQLGGLVLADIFTSAFLGRRDRIERTTLVNATAGLVRLVGFNRAKGLVLWFGRTLEGDKTTSLRADAFPDMDTAAAVNSLQAVAPSPGSTSTSP